MSTSHRPQEPRTGGVFARGWGHIVSRARTSWGWLSARPGVQHLIRAWQRSSDRLGGQFAAAITYFSFLSLVPILMVAFSIAGMVLASQPALLDKLKSAVTSLMPGEGLGDAIAGQIDNAVGQSLTVGVIGLVIALYSGLNWMGNVRDAVRAQWRPRWKKPEQPFTATLWQYLWDLASLGGLLVAIAVSIALTTVGTVAQNFLADWLGIGDGSLLGLALRIGPFALAIIASTATFAWLYTMLPERDHRADRRTLIIGSAAMAVIFEILKAALALLVSRSASSPSGAVFGSIIGLLLFFNLVARGFLMVAAWMATARPAAESATVTS